MIQEAIARYLQKQQQAFLSPKAVLFDMDGVLYDSMRFHARAWYETATRHQLNSTPELFYLYEGRTGESTINELYQKTFQRDATDEEKKSIYEEKGKHSVDYKYQTFIYNNSDCHYKPNSCSRYSFVELICCSQHRFPDSSSCFVNALPGCCSFHLCGSSSSSSS